MTDLFGTPEGKRAERVEWGRRFTRDCAFGQKGQVESAPGPEAARGDDSDSGPGGAYYPGGPKTFVPVRRVVVTYTGPWETPPTTVPDHDEEQTHG